MANETGLVAFNKIIKNENTQAYLQAVLGERKQTFVTSLTSIVTNNTALQQCEPLSLMYSAIKATSLGLSVDPNLGLAYVIPYKDSRRGVTIAQCQLGYKAFVQLAMRSGQLKKINVVDVHEGELVDEDILTGDVKLKRIDGRENKPIIGYAAYIMLTNGMEKTEYWPKEKVEKHAKRYSQTYHSSNDYVRNNSKWSTDFDSMARKTVLKSLLAHWSPQSVEMNGTSAAVIDQAVYSPEQVQKAIDSMAEYEPVEEYIDNPSKAELNAAITEAAEAQVDKETGEIFQAEQPQPQTSKSKKK